MPADAADVVGIRENELQLKHPRQWGACWLSSVLWQQLKLDEFWSVRLWVRVRCSQRAGSSCQSAFRRLLVPADSPGASRPSSVANASENPPVEMGLTADQLLRLLT